MAMCTVFVDSLVSTNSNAFRLACKCTAIYVLQRSVIHSFTQDRSHEILLLVFLVMKVFGTTRNFILALELLTSLRSKLNDRREIAAILLHSPQTTRTMIHALHLTALQIFLKTSWLKRTHNIMSPCSSAVNRSYLETLL
jgi:hypothetical protein